jgi:hemerythrin
MENQVMIEYRWDESMRTGDETADTQHRELIRQMNLLLSAMSAGQASTQIDSSLEFLAKYAAEHFQHEEECMEAYHCPAAVANKAAHAQFMKRFGEYRHKLQADATNESAVSIQMLRELSDWLVNHIRRIDSQLLFSINMQPANPAPVA